MCRRTAYLQCELGSLPWLRDSDKVHIAELIVDVCAPIEHPACVEKHRNKPNTSHPVLRTIELQESSVAVAWGLKRADPEALARLAEILHDTSARTTSVCLRK